MNSIDKMMASAFTANFTKQIARMQTHRENPNMDADDARITLDKLIYQARDLSGLLED